MVDETLRGRRSHRNEPLYGTLPESEHAVTEGTRGLPASRHRPNVRRVIDALCFGLTGVMLLIASRSTTTGLGLPALLIGGAALLYGAWIVVSRGAYFTTPAVYAFAVVAVIVLFT